MPYLWVRFQYFADLTFWIMRWRLQSVSTTHHLKAGSSVNLFDTAYSATTQFLATSFLDTFCLSVRFNYTCYARLLSCFWVLHHGGSFHSESKRGFSLQSLLAHALLVGQPYGCKAILSAIGHQTANFPPPPPPLSLLHSVQSTQRESHFSSVPTLLASTDTPSDFLAHHLCLLGRI